MKYKGYELKVAHHLTYRQAQVGVNEDTYLNGEIIEPNYIVIVKKSQCPTYERNGRTYVDPKDVKGIPIGFHTRTNMCYGKVNKRGYYGLSMPVYAVLDGRVYQGSIQPKEKVILGYTPKNRKHWMDQQIAQNFTATDTIIHYHIKDSRDNDGGWYQYRVMIDKSNGFKELMNMGPSLPFTYDMGLVVTGSGGTHKKMRWHVVVGKHAVYVYKEYHHHDEKVPYITWQQIAVHYVKTTVQKLVDHLEADGHRPSIVAKSLEAYEESSNWEYRRPEKLPHENDMPRGAKLLMENGVYGK